MRNVGKRRAAFVCIFLALILTGFSARLIYLQVGKHAEYTALAARKHSLKITIPPKRGMIHDRNNEVLAANVPVRRVVIDGSHVKNPKALAELASPYLDIPADRLEKELTTSSKYKILMPELAEEKAVALIKAMDEKSLRGIYFYPNSVRTYPNGHMLSHVIGFLSRKDPNDDHLTGVEGIERSMENYLRGEEGFRYIERDRTGREMVVYRGQEQAPKHGMSVQLTVDMGLQAILENELDNACKELRPETATGILMDPKTGEIMAMASRPNFDINRVGQAKPEQMINRCIMSVVEPGSTFKIVVAAGAINEKKVNEKSLIFCENGRFSYGGRILRDHHGYGQMTVHDILVKSSNIGSAKMALMMGDEMYFNYVRSFGFGEKTGIELPGETVGIVPSPQRWDKLTITRMPMGHAIAVTPLQIVSGMSVIANGGKLMRPQIVRSVRSAEGDEIISFQPEVVREVVPENVANYVRNALAGVVGDGGTATLARVGGFTVAGKTGTAQKVNPKGGYYEGKYVVSFVGFMPIEDPRFVCLILIDDAKIPSGLNYGGLVAAPIFSRVAEKTARYLNMIPTDPVAPVAMQGRRPPGTLQP